MKRKVCVYVQVKARGTNPVLASGHGVAEVLLEASDVGTEELERLGHRRHAGCGRADLCNEPLQRRLLERGVVADSALDAHRDVLLQLLVLR